MTWQAASFAVLGVVLAGGFAWYERSRPPSQVVALVAAMAALAVAGRLALAPIPNVVATTDIVLITGFAVGAAPGFATGALAGLVSNFWLGQGPWTPWQMAAWGLCGVFGAGLGLLTRGKIGRFQLAAACGLAGVAYGALLNFSLMVTYGGEVSFDRFAALSVRAIPFDAAHAIGNITLALLAGPALVRMLLRFRQRFEVDWRANTTSVKSLPAGAAGIVALLAAGLLALQPAVSAEAAGGPSAASSWLRSHQNGDGGWGSSAGGSSNVSMTEWAALGLEAAGRNPLDVSKGGSNPISYLRHNSSRINSTGDLERTIIVLGGAGVNPRSFEGRNLVAELAGRLRGVRRDGVVNLAAFGVIAMRAAHSTSGVSSTVSWLKDAQHRDGGWGIDDRAKSPSDADSTGAALQAVRSGASAAKGVRYLRKVQSRNGGYSVGTSGPTNSQSTAWAAQGLLAAGAGASDALRYLARSQAGDGHYRYSSSSDQTPVWVTGQVLAAVSHEAFPISAVPRSASSSSAGGGGGGGGGGAIKGLPGAGGGIPGVPGSDKGGSSSGAGSTGTTATTGDSRSRLKAPGDLPVENTAPATQPVSKQKKIIGGGVGAAAALGAGVLVWFRRRYGSLPWT